MIQKKNLLILNANLASRVKKKKTPIMEGGIRHRNVRNGGLEGNSNNDASDKDRLLSSSNNQNREMTDDGLRGSSNENFQRRRYDGSQVRFFVLPIVLDLIFVRNFCFVS